MLATTDPTTTVLAVAAAAVAGLATAAWYWLRARGRTMRDLPTSKAAGVAIGLHEVTGRVVSDQAVLSPYGGIRCVWWRATRYVERNDAEAGATSRQRWTRTGERVGGPAFFHVADDTGRVPVFPRKAEIRGIETYDGPDLPSRDERLPSWYTPLARASTSRTRVVEHVIPVGDEVYVLGTARLPVADSRPEIGPDERGRDPFVIHVGDEEAAATANRATVQAAFGAAMLAGAAAGALWRLHPAGAGLDPVTGAAEVGGPTLDWWGPAVGVAAVLGVMALASVAFVYNGLVALRNRVHAAWGLIDVELRRRHDLVPALEPVVAAARDHERTVQTLMAELRATTAPDLPTRPTDDAVHRVDRTVSAETKALDALLARIEAHPTLGADATFIHLRDQLVDTENRIALARRFYNDSVTTLRDRSATLPGAVVARLTGLVLHAEFALEPVRHPPAPGPRPGPPPAQVAAALYDAPPVDLC